MSYIEKYVTQADMSTGAADQAALNGAGRGRHRRQMVTVNADSDKYKEDAAQLLRWRKELTITTKDGQRVENKEIYWDWDGYYYLQWNGWYLERVDVQKVEVKPT